MSGNASSRLLDGALLPTGETLILLTAQCSLKQTRGKVRNCVINHFDVSHTSSAARYIVTVNRVEHCVNVIIFTMMGDDELLFWVSSLSGVLTFL